MNERIKALARKSGLSWAEDVGCGFPDIKYPTGYEKFAELIVRENIRLISVRKNEGIDNGWNVDETCSAIEMDLVEHFGIDV